MQLVVYPSFRQRVLYYWAKLHQGQLQENEDYSELRPTITICFVNTPMYPEVPDYHLVFELWERHYQVAFSGDLVLHVLELPKFLRSAENLETPPDQWLYFLPHAEHLDTEAFPAALDVPEIHRAMGELQMVTQSG
jgi:predicted transposase/invertase (TIGR01784 family)